MHIYIIYNIYIYIYMTILRHKKIPPTLESEISDSGQNLWLRKTKNDPTRGKNGSGSSWHVWVATVAVFCVKVRFRPRIVRTRKCRERFTSETAQSRRSVIRFHIWSSTLVILLASLNIPFESWTTMTAAPCVRFGLISPGKTAPVFYPKCLFSSERFAT